MKNILYISLLISLVGSSCYSMELLEKYANTETKAVSYADVSQLRDIFSQELPEKVEIPEIQKRLLACYTLQYFKKNFVINDYSAERSTLTKKMQNLFDESAETPSEPVQKALMYLYEKPDQNATQLLESLQSNLAKLEAKQQEVQQAFEKNEEHIKKYTENANTEGLQRAQSRKPQLQQDVVFTQLAIRLDKTRIEKTQSILEHEITTLEKQINDFQLDESRRNQEQLDQYKQDLQKAKQVLAHSKGEGSFLKDWITGY